MTDKDKRHLYYLDELSDYKVDSDDPDVRGWEVKDADNRVIGKVDNLLVNKEKKRVVYLDVEVDKSIIDANHKPYGKPASGDVHEFINKDGENHLIIPIGLAHLNTDEKFVYTNRVNHETFAETKRMEKGAPVHRDYEVVVIETYNRDLTEEERAERNRKATISNDDSEFYDRPEFDRTKDRHKR
ncbi:PRC-barrel domain-containing protein [Salinimicrobium soli]|uniref:PRC-barrel domain-containing protein n=1 Tax=Salinimicrobium soli TaxID=1254399 RepID=UPI003AAD2A87